MENISTNKLEPELPSELVKVELNEESNDDTNENPSLRQQTSENYDITETTENSTPSPYGSGQNLTERSKIKYDHQYNSFIEWSSKRNITEYTEPVLLQYFIDKSSSLKSSSLWAMYSMLRSTFIAKLNINIGNFKGLLGFLKQASFGYVSEKTKIFNRDEINRFLSQAPDNQTYLMYKVHIKKIKIVCVLCAFF